MSKSPLRSGTFGPLSAGMKRLLRLLVSILPDSWRGRLVRLQFKVRLENPDGIEFKLAETEVELRSALRLLHDSYVASGLMHPHPSGMRATAYHALPTTSTLIAKKKGQVIATVSMVRNNPLGLPLEKIFNLDKIKAKSAQITEISSLAIHPDFRGHKGLFFLLTKYLMEYSLCFYNVDFWVIAVNPRHYSIYRHIFLFDDLEKSVVAYDFVCGAPAMGLVTDLAQLKIRFFEMYSKGPYYRDLYSFYFNSGLTLSCFKFPDRTFHKTMDPVLTPKIFKNIFIDSTDLLNEISAAELQLLYTCYSSAPEFLKLFPTKNLERSYDRRRGASRFGVRFEGFVIPLEKGRLIPISVTSVTTNGFLAELKTPDLLSQDELFHARIKIGPFNIEDLLIKVRWVSAEKTVGFEIVGQSNSWGFLIAQLMFELNGNVA